MKLFATLIGISIVFLACDINQYTKVYIDNQNSFPIEVNLKTNNIDTRYIVAANGTIDTLRKFTDITREDGQWVIIFSNADTKQLIKQHKHGKFFKGELANQFSMKTKGAYFEFSVDN